MHPRCKVRPNLTTLEACWRWPSSASIFCPVAFFLPSHCSSISWILNNLFFGNLISIFDVLMVTARKVCKVVGPSIFSDARGRWVCQCWGHVSFGWPRLCSAATAYSEVSKGCLPQCLHNRFLPYICSPLPQNMWAVPCGPLVRLV